MKKLFIICCLVGLALVGCDNKKPQCAYIDGYGVHQICEKQFPDETEYFCSDVSTYMKRHLPNRIASKLCYNRLTESERNEFLDIFDDGIKYAKGRKYLYR